MNADLAALDLVRPKSWLKRRRWLSNSSGLSAHCRVCAPGVQSLPASSVWSLGGPLGLRPQSARWPPPSAFASGCGGPGIRAGQSRGSSLHYEAGRVRRGAGGLARGAQRLASDAPTAANRLQRLHLNAGRALHQLGEFDRAETESLSALRSEISAEIRATVAWFHVGNHRWSNDDLLGARLAYIEALREAPELARRQDQPGTRESDCSPRLQEDPSLTKRQTNHRWQTMHRTTQVSQDSPGQSDSLSANLPSPDSNEVERERTGNRSTDGSRRR